MKLNLGPMGFEESQFNCNMQGFAGFWNCWLLLWYILLLMNDILKFTLLTLNHNIYSRFVSPLLVTAANDVKPLPLGEKCCFILCLFDLVTFKFVA